MNIELDLKWLKRASLVLLGNILLLTLLAGSNPDWFVFISIALFFTGGLFAVFVSMIGDSIRDE